VKLKSAFVIAVLAWALAPPAAVAQVSGRLTGSVVDVSGAGVAGASVSLKLAGGAKTVLAASASQTGLFELAGVRPEYYDVEVSAPGFEIRTLRGVKIDPAQQTVLPPVRLELSAVRQTVDVAANAQAVQTANAEVTTTVSQAQVVDLPVLDRQINKLFLIEPGVTLGRGYTTINGLRSSMINVTLDGVNVQDNYIRTNGMDYIPNRLTIAQVAEFSVNTSNASASAGGGAAQAALITPSGNNRLRGEGYWYNRNSALSANDWFNNRNGVARPFLNLNQMGGAIGGPIVRDKLLFYVNYEAFRNRNMASANFTTLRPDARNGVFSYRVNGAVRTVDVLQARNRQIDPAVQAMLDQLPAQSNNSTRGDGLNSGGYSFNARNNRTRDNILAKLDYNHSVRHVFSGTYSWNREMVDRPDLGHFFTTTPPVYGDNHAHLAALGWRWNPGPTFTNELRGGFNLAPANFKVRPSYPGYLLDNTTLSWDTPVNDFLAQGRATNTYNLNDAASWFRGAHAFSFGFEAQRVSVALYDDAATLPVYGLGFSASSTQGLTQADLPGVSSSDLAAANLLLADLSGTVASYTQSFNITSRTSGFVAGAPNQRRLRFDSYAGYFQDSWRVRPRLTLTLGLRWEYVTPLDERDSLALLPQIQGGFVSTLLNPDAVLDFAGAAAGRPFYNRDWNNFGPNIGFAWDVFGGGKTAVRGGYSIFYANDDTIAAVWNDVSYNSGLRATAAANNLNGQLTSALPAIPAPAFKVPRTVRDNFALAPSSNITGLPDPTLRTPYVQEWNLSVEREAGHFLVRARYVGNHLVKGLRAFDYNQVVVRQNGFLDDFLRAQGNGNIALQAKGVFDPAYNPALAGSQPLTVFPLLLRGGDLANSTIRSTIQRGEVGTLAQTYFTGGYTANSPVQFFPNPATLGANTISSYSSSSYNALQLDFTRRLARFWVQGSYSFSKVLSDEAGDGQTRFEAFLDNASPSIERARAPFDLTHVFKLVYSVPLPLGRQHRLSYAPLDRLLTGWSMSGFVQYQSGTPYSVLSGRGTLNRGARSTLNTVDTPLDMSQLDQLVGFFMTGAGPYFIDPRTIGSDGRGVAADGQPPYNGQVFFNPAAGFLGALQRRLFSGPWNFNWDASVAKETRLTEGQTLQFRADFYNLPNHPSFYVGNESSSSTRFNVNQNTFGKVAATFNTPRVVQFGLYYKF